MTASYTPYRMNQEDGLNSDGGKLYCNHGDGWTLLCWGWKLFVRPSSCPDPELDGENFLSGEYGLFLNIWCFYKTMFPKNTKLFLNLTLLLEHIDTPCTFRMREDPELCSRLDERPCYMSSWLGVTWIMSRNAGGFCSHRDSRCCWTATMMKNILFSC